MEHVRAGILCGAARTSMSVPMCVAAETDFTAAGSKYDGDCPVKGQSPGFRYIIMMKPMAADYLPK